MHPGCACGRRQLLLSIFFPTLKQAFIFRVLLSVNKDEQQKLSRGCSRSCRKSERNACRERKAEDQWCHGPQLGRLVHNRSGDKRCTLACTQRFDKGDFPRRDMPFHRCSYVHKGTLHEWSGKTKFWIGRQSFVFACSSTNSGCN